MHGSSPLPRAGQAANGGPKHNSFQHGKLAIPAIASYVHPVLYLASRSPQRAMLLQRAAIAFQVVDSHCDETTVLHDHPQVLCLERARAKARAAVLTAQMRSRDVVILGADTVVALNGVAIGKPSDRADAQRILTSLQGTVHHVYTGHCCVFLGSAQHPANEAARIAVTRVTMRPMSPADIAAYVASGESDGRAGAYAIQETGDRFVAEMDGRWDTVVGLNITMVERLYGECTGLPLPKGAP
jgi:septum formation protein